MLDTYISSNVENFKNKTTNHPNSYHTKITYVKFGEYYMLILRA